MMALQPDAASKQEESKENVSRAMHSCALQLAVATTTTTATLGLHAHRAQKTEKLHLEI